MDLSFTHIGAKVVANFVGERDVANGSWNVSTVVENRDNTRI